MWSRLVNQLTPSLSGSLYAPPRTFEPSRQPEVAARIVTRLYRVARTSALAPGFADTARAFVQLVASITPAVAPTAQLNVDDDGTVQGTWLVHRSELTLSLCADGSGFILATGSDGSVLIDEDFEIRTSPPGANTLFAACQFLASLGEKVDARVWQ